MRRRHATLDDLDAVVAMGERFRSQTAYQAFVARNPLQMRTLATRLIAGAPDSVIFVAETRQALVGMLAALVHTHFLSGERVAGEVAWWVDPEARGQVGVRLLKDAERWARSRGAVSFEMIAPTPRVEELYVYLGYAPVERTYQRRF